tara:strand:+ start:3955 stop:4557 length:603 start_codon:yes stop_codon:yes gene_type:complete
MVSFSDVAEFYLKYKGDPTSAGWEKFAELYGIPFLENLEDETDSANEFEEWTDLNPLFMQTLAKFLDGKGVIMRRTEPQAVFILPYEPYAVEIKDFKRFAKFAQESSWSIKELITVRFEPEAELSSLTQDELKDIQNFDVPGTWFDSDDDWGYTHWSKFINRMGFEEDDDMATFIEFDILNFDTVLNWKDVETLRKIFAV